MPIQVTPSIVIPDALVEERFVRASGPGGQNVNKVSTAVELRCAVGQAGLPADMLSRLEALAGQRWTVGGVIVIQAREHRTQSKNRDAARARLLALLRQAARRPKPRRQTRPSGAQREGRITAKKLIGEKKRRRTRAGDDD